MHFLAGWEVPQYLGLLCNGQCSGQEGDTSISRCLSLHRMQILPFHQEGRIRLRVPEPSLWKKLISLTSLLAHLSITAQGYPCLCGGEDNWVKRARSAAKAGEQCEHRMEKKVFLHSYQLTLVCIFRLFPGRQHKEPPFESPELPLPTSEEHRQTGQVHNMD